MKYTKKKKPFIVMDEKLPDKQQQLINNICEIKWLNDINIWIDEYADIIEGMYINGHPNIDMELINLFPNLKIISNEGTGTNHIDTEFAKKKNIQVGYTPSEIGYAADSVAELAIGLMISSGREFFRANNRARNGIIDDSWLTSGLIEKNIGIIGLGNIGKNIAKKLQSFRCKSVIYYNRKQIDINDEKLLNVTYSDSLNHLLASCDYVILSLSTNQDNINMISDNELALMKTGATIINIARGKILDSLALSRELPRIKAVLDVTEPEPLPKNHPLLKHDENCLLITPHIGTAIPETRLYMTKLAIDNLNKGLANQPISFHV